MTSTSLPHENLIRDLFLIGNEYLDSFHFIRLFLVTCFSIFLLLGFC